MLAAVYLGISEYQKRLDLIYYFACDQAVWETILDEDRDLHQKDSYSYKASAKGHILLTSSSDFPSAI